VAPAYRPAPNTRPVVRAAALQPTREEYEQIQANPDIVAAYRANPDPMLALLRRMMEAVKTK
jgi:hypothetical protein